MRLKTFNPENTRTARKGVSMISFNAKTGVMMLNTKAVEQIGIQAGDHVQFHQDEEDIENWYVEKVAENGFALRGKEGGGLYTNSVALVRQIFECVEYEGSSGTALIAGEATIFGKRKLFGIITARIKTSR